MKLTIEIELSRKKRDYSFHIRNKDEEVEEETKPTAPITTTHHAGLFEVAPQPFGYGYYEPAEEKQNGKA